YRPVRQPCGLPTGGASGRPAAGDRPLLRGPGHAGGKRPAHEGRAAAVHSRQGFVAATEDPADRRRAHAPALPADARRPTPAHPRCRRGLRLRLRRRRGRGPLAVSRQPPPPAGFPRPRRPAGQQQDPRLQGPL
ncbi:MAG: hypothetical protein ACK55Z_00450, partial [bacterium]